MLKFVIDYTSFILVIKDEPLFHLYRRQILALKTLRF